MKKQLLKGCMLALFALAAQNTKAQCLDAPFEQYPFAVFEPACNGSEDVIESDCYSGEYSLVAVVQDVSYTFSSSISTDFLTIGNEDGSVAYASGTGSVVWVAASSGTVRFYTHDNDGCEFSEEERSRIVTCGEPPVCNDPIVSVPYTMGFEDGESTACLSYQDVNGGSESGWAIMSDIPTDFGDYSMIYTYDSDFPGDDWFYTAGLNLTAGTSYDVNFKFRGGLGVGGYLENLEVKYGDAASASAMVSPTLATYEDIDTSFDSDFANGTGTFTPTTTGVYYIGFHSYSDADQGYIQIDDVSVSPSLATGDFNKNAFTHFPNPVKDVLHVSYDNNIENVAVYNLLGQIVLQKSINSSKGEVDMTPLSAGSYIVKLTSGTATKTVKVMKQ